MTLLSRDEPDLPPEVEQLDTIAAAVDDLAAATLLNEARDQLFREIERRETKAA